MKRKKNQCIQQAIKSDEEKSTTINIVGDSCFQVFYLFCCHFLMAIYIDNLTRNKVCKKEKKNKQNSTTNIFKYNAHLFLNRLHYIAR